MNGLIKEESFISQKNLLNAYPTV